LKGAESCALYNCLNKGYNRKYDRFQKNISSPAKRVRGETSFQGSNPCLSAILKELGQFEFSQIGLFSCLIYKIVAMRPWIENLPFYTAYPTQKIPDPDKREPGVNGIDLWVKCEYLDFDICNKWMPRYLPN